MKNNYLLYLSGVISEEKLIESSKEHDLDNYMFFQNLQTVKECIDEILKMNSSEVDSLLSDGHDWANDHVSGAKTSLEQVCAWLKNSLNKEQNLEGL
jgi:hypothetical protein